MPGATPLSAVERKLQNKKNSNGGVVKRAKSFSSSAPSSPSLVKRNKPPPPEPRYTKSTYLLHEARRLAKELEERKKHAPLTFNKPHFMKRPMTAGGVSLRTRSNSGSSSGSSGGGGSTELIKQNKKNVTAELTKINNDQTEERKPRSQSYTRRLIVKSTAPLLQENIRAVRKKSVGELSGRLTPLRNSGRRTKNLSSSTPCSKNACAECGQELKSGFYSEHQGLIYCNVPCYTGLFNSMFADTANSCSTLSDEQKSLRTRLLPRLRTYNAYYCNTPCQICCKEMNDKFVLEGVIKVYWGLRSPVTLVDSQFTNHHHWNHVMNARSKTTDKNTTIASKNISKNAVFSSKNITHSNGYMATTGGDNTENVPPIIIGPPHGNKVIKMASQGLRGRRYSYKRKTCGVEGGKKRIGCSVCNGSCSSDPLSQKSTTFIPPYGTPTTLRITNHVKSPQLIDMLFKKFQIKDSRRKYTLLTLFESGGQRRIPSDGYPLITRLNLGPCEDVAKIFIMESAEQTDIPLEVAQYINFATAVLDTFIQKFHEEEEREAERIREKYEEYRSLIKKRMDELERKGRTTLFEE